MKKNQHLLISVVFFGAYVLSACSGAAPQQREDLSQPSSSSQSTEVVFTGTVESVGADQWLISGQAVGVDGATAIDPNVQAGDIVKVEGIVSSEGKILALTIESSGADDVNDNAANSNDGNVNSNDDANTNDDNGNDNSNDNANTNSNDNSNGATDDEQEIFGIVQTITAESVTIDGVTYQFADDIEIKNIILEGDQIKLHLVVTADGTVLVREIEKVDSINGNDNGNSNDDDDNGNSNSNDDDDNGNSNDDDDNGNSNDDDDDDDDDNDNSNDNG